MQSLLQCCLTASRWCHLPNFSALRSNKHELDLTDLLMHIIKTESAYSLLLICCRVHMCVVAPPTSAGVQSHRSKTAAAAAGVQSGSA